MKNRIILICLIIVVILSLIIFRSKIFKTNKVTEEIDPNDKTVKLIIYPEYEKYLLNQSIWIKVIILNNSEKPYQLKNPVQFYGVNFDITGPDNNKIYSGLNHDFLKMDSVFLSVNDSVEAYINLDPYMQTSFQLEKKLTGSFKIKANYQGLESNTLYFNISYPDGDDKELFDQTFGANYVLSNDDQTRKLEDLLNKYRTSPYCSQLYNCLMTAAINQDDTTRFLNNVQNFFENNSDSYGSIFIIQSYMTYLNSKMKLDHGQIEQRKQHLEIEYNGKFAERCLTNDNFEINK